jgi:peptidoglycan hydrolase CwlO-like protein
LYPHTGQKSYADATRTAPNQPDHISIKDLTNMIKSIQNTVELMKNQLSELYKRINLLEQDAAEQHLNDLETVNSDNMEEDTTLSTDSSNTIIHNNKTDKLDIRNTQQTLNDKLDQMGSTMNEMLTLFNLTQLKPTHDSPVPSQPKLK